MAVAPKSDLQGWSRLDRSPTRASHRLAAQCARPTQGGTQLDGRNRIPRGTHRSHRSRIRPPSRFREGEDRCHYLKTVELSVELAVERPVNVAAVETDRGTHRECAGEASRKSNADRRQATVRFDAVCDRHRLPEGVECAFGRS